MKKQLSFPILLLAFFACTRQTQSPAPPGPWPGVSPKYLANVRTYLKNNLYDSDYRNLDTNNLVLSVQPAGSFLRVGLLNQRMSEHFILLQTDSNGNCLGGKFIQCLHDSTMNSRRSSPTITSSLIIIESLKHESVVQQKLTNSVVTMECSGGQEIESLSTEGGCDVVPSCDNCMPEVVIVGYIPTETGSSSSVTYSEYLDLSILINGVSSGNNTTVGSNGSVAGVYSPEVISDNPGGPGNVVRPSADITVYDDETSMKPAIDVAAFMKCFATIPDAGASCSVAILDDLPVNDNPAYIFNILSGATGHTFLQLTKTNGSQSVTQIIGFTTSKPLAILGIPVAGKMVDNSGHKYNASLTMPLTPAELTTEINAINALGSNQQYDIWEYNCVNYAVGVLNKVRPGNPLQVIPLNDVTSGDSYSTPQGLYLALEKMKNQNGPEAKNITVGVIANAGVSHGACTP